MLAIEKLLDSKRKINTMNIKLENLKQEYKRRLFQTIKTKEVSLNEINQVEQKLERIKIKQYKKIDFCFLLNCTRSSNTSYFTLINHLIDKLNDNNLEIRFAIICYKNISKKKISIILNTPFLEEIDLFKSIVLEKEDFIIDNNENINSKDYGLNEISQLDWINETKILFHISDFFTSNYEILLNTCEIFDINYYFAGKDVKYDDERSTKINFLELDKIDLELVIKSIMDTFLGKYCEKKNRCLKIRKIDSEIPNWNNLSLFKKFKADYFAVNYLENLKDIKSDNNLSYRHTICQIWIKDQPFSKGAMRFAYPAVLNLGDEYSDCLLNCVVKDSIFSDPKYNTKKYHEESIQVQVISSYLAQKFSQIYKSESKLKFLG